MGRRMVLPLIGEVNSLLGKKGFPFETSTTQKINIIADNLIVAFSGPLDQAERALKALSYSCSKHPATKESVFDAVNSIDPEKIDQLCMIGLVAEQTDKNEFCLHHFDLAVDPIEIKPYGNIYVSGTGARTFCRLLETFGTNNQSEGAAGIDLLKGTALAIVNVLTGLEVESGSTIAERWGGGFEIAYFEDGKFKKLGNLLHTFWRIRKSSDNIELIPMFYKVDYWQDVTRIRSVKFKIGENGIILESNDVHLIFPVLKSEKDYKLTDMSFLDFSHDVLCCHAVGPEDDDRQSVILSDPAKLFEFKVGDKGLQFRYSEEFPKRLRAALRWN